MIADREQASAGQDRLTTIVRGVLLLPQAAGRMPQAASLLDAAGRRVFNLSPGKNHVSRLARGFYFERKADRGALSAAEIREVVIR